MKKWILFFFIISLLYGFEYKITWLGNTFGGGEKWVQDFIESIFVTPDGTVYTASYWDEAGREFGIYKNGDVIGFCQGTHGWGTLGGFAVAVNSKYIFISHSQGNERGHLQGEKYPSKGKSWIGVSRYNKDGKPAPFPDGSGKFKAMRIIHEVSEEEEKNAHIMGLAANEIEIFVSDTYGNEIKVYDTETMQLINSWKTKNKPFQITLDKKNNVWIIEKDEEGYKIQKYSSEGDILPQSIKFEKSVIPTCLCIDKKGNLYVGDNGKSQQILIYGDLEKKPKLIKKFGEEGGVYGKGGLVSPLRFSGIRGVGVDENGNIYVGCNSFGSILRAFSPDGKLLWELMGLEFVHTADPDPTTDGIDVYSATKHYKMDWNKTEPGSEWKLYSFTIDPFRYPNDPRFTNLEAPLIRYIKGKKYLIMRGMYETYLAIYRFEGEIAVPSVIFSNKHLGGFFDNIPQPEKGRWIWRDKNGDGKFQSDEFYDADSIEEWGWAWWVDEEGGVWHGLENCKIHYYPLLGIDEYGNPIYKRESVREFDVSVLFTNLERVEYHPKSDTMYLGGYTNERPKPKGEWGLVGTVILKIDNWMKGDRNVSKKFELPHDKEKNLYIKAFCTAGDYLFAVECRSAKLHIYDVRTGDKVGEIQPKESGWVDFPDAIRGIKRENGEYIIFVEEDWKNKVLIYRLKF
jgi:hypothetical protein